MGNYHKWSRLVLDCTHALAKKGVLVGTGGNVSARVEGEDCVAITPSSREYLGLTTEDICIVNFDMQMLEGTSAPSVETGMHVAIYKLRQDVNAVIHTHQVYASALAIINQAVPPLFDEQVANLGDKVAIVPYAVSGSTSLLENISAAVVNRCNAFILQNHGAVLLGLDIPQASRNVEILEKAAKAYYLALVSGKEITTIPADMTAAVFDMLQSEQRKEIRRKKKLQKGGESA
jgi:L-ribulose-5-phosphate 4-epimerase